MANWPAYRLLNAAAERLGLPHQYRTDLIVHDRIALSRRDAPQAFGWLIRKGGTDILRAGTAYARGTTRYYLQGGDSARFYWYEDGALTPLTGEELLARLKQERHPTSAIPHPDGIS